MGASGDGTTPLLAASRVSKTYGEGHGNVLVLDDVSLELRRDEIIALLGPSGSGKSTLLRILAGLVPPSSGTVLVDGAPLRGVNPRAAMVFQSFALYPWLTVRDNVELGLLASGLPSDERRERALRAIDLIGLDGFEEAYPKELSGGMRQRVGFARALVVEPEVLLLDEPFSALDVLTADNLRRELRTLWRERQVPIRAILIVTHNIAEAVVLADRLLVFGANPGRIRVELPGLPPAERAPERPAHGRLVDTIYQIMTNPSKEAAQLQTGSHAVQSRASAPAYQMLPHVSIGDLTGFLQRLYVYGGREDLFELARDLQMDADELLPLAEAADLLGLGDVEEGDVFLTRLGRRFAEAGVLEEKDIFRRQARANVALLRRIARDLGAASDHRLREGPILADLERSFSPEEARRQLDTAIDWGRYAELFSFDDDTGVFSADDVDSG